MVQKVKFNSEIVRDGRVIASYTDLLDVKCNAGYVVFVKNGGNDGEIFLPMRGDIIRVISVEGQASVESYQ